MTEREKKKTRKMGERRIREIGRRERERGCEREGGGAGGGEKETERARKS